MDIYGPSRATPKHKNFTGEMYKSLYNGHSQIVYKGLSLIIHNTGRQQFGDESDDVTLVIGNELVFHVKSW